MAKLEPSQIFNCTEAYCFEGEIYPRSIEYGRKVDMGVSLSRVWLIRPGWNLEEISESEVTDHLTSQGVEAEWVDSESDARAMAGVPA